ncbi:54S ribosomal protein L6 mitochondrial [Microbotryomycetes sp. JL201]|nr:54S ribosomal protein L6 mitochondrial [Microbotryomycetes sp. JL201]
MQRRLSSLACAACRAPTARQLSTCAPAQSHIGSLPIPVPPQVQLDFVDSAASDARSRTLKVSGPKGNLLVDVKPFVTIARTTGSTSSPGVASSSSSSSYAVRIDDATVKHQRAIWGLTRSLLANAVHGVSTGYSVNLKLVGVGYRAAVEDIPPDATARASTSGARRRLNLKLGYAHPVYIDLPPDIDAQTPSTTSIVLSGIDKQRLGELAARIRRWRKPEPYNGKGIFVNDEVVKRKEVKKK